MERRYVLRNAKTHRIATTHYATESEAQRELKKYQSLGASNEWEVFSMDMDTHPIKQQISDAMK